MPGMLRHFAEISLSGKRWGWALAVFCAAGGLFWLLWLVPTRGAVSPTERKPTGAVIAMNDPAIHYSSGWRVDSNGADPVEPADPWHEPSGIFTLTYQGREVALLLAVGDYWGYLFATVDGEPANLLPVIAGNLNSEGQAAGYKPLYAPEAQQANGPALRWLPIHRDPSSGEHQLRVEVWRSWGQVPVRAAAVDALPPPGLPTWPGVLLLVVAAITGAYAVAPHLVRHTTIPAALQRIRTATAALLWLSPLRRDPILGVLALLALLLLAFSILTRLWTVALLGLALLAYVGTARPYLWMAVLLFGLPFYFSQTLPLLPQRAVGLVDIGIWGGLVVTAAHFLLFVPLSQDDLPLSTPVLRLPGASNLLFLISGWALVSTAAAEQGAVALREWRTVFLAAALFALLLAVCLRRAPVYARWVLVFAWLAGGTVIALIGLWHFATGDSLITAEGVLRIRSVYGSPNNLALYLERTLAVTLVLALFLPALPKLITQETPRREAKSAMVKEEGQRLVSRLSYLRGGLLLCVLVQLAALLLTFSKGALLLGLPVLLLTLAFGAVMLLGWGPSLRRLWWLAAVALVIGGAMLPFLPSERFQRLLDLSQGTGFLRIQLWRSAWQMALDHALLGVGPDNFLYAFRSGYLLPAAWQEPDLNHPHNWPLDWWTRLGLPGLVLGISFFAAGLWSLLRRLREKESSAERALHLGLLAAALAALAHGLIDASYALPDLMLVWVLLFGL